jgi:hypothetical protein
MKKTTLLLALSALIAIKSLAQSASASATQETSLALSNAIALSFTNPGSTNINMTFNNQNDMNNGLETIDHEVLVQSNLPFDVKVATPTNFSYAGSSITNNIMPVFDKFKMKIVDNNTGGTNVLGNSGYNDVTGTTTQIFSSCPASGNATFAIRYKFRPTSGYAPGVYSMNIVYTATQM